MDVKPAVIAHARFDPQFALEDREWNRGDNPRAHHGCTRRPEKKKKAH